MKKYIKRSELGIITSEIATEAMKNADKMSVEMSIQKYSTETCLEVVMRDCNFMRVHDEKYVIVPDLLGWEEVTEDTIITAVNKIHEAETTPAEETPSNNY